MSLSESFQVVALVEKLPPAWKDFKNYLKHKRKEMTMDELIVRLRIEEDNPKAEKRLKRGIVKIPLSPRLMWLNMCPNYITKRGSLLKMTLNKVTTMAIKSSKINAIIVARPDIELLITATLRRIAKVQTRSAPLTPM